VREEIARLAGKLSLIVPTYMEAGNITSLAERLRKSLRGCDYEVLVVDDSSPDGTWKEAMRAGFNVIVRPGKMGLASAFVDGMERTRGELVGLMDADLQHPPEVIGGMLNEIHDGADLVVASRYAEGGIIEGLPLHRRIASKTAIALAHLLLPKTREVNDPMSGFFIVKREAVQDVGLSRTKGFKILLEILVKGKYGRLAEVPYRFEPRKKGESKLGRGEIWEYLKQLNRLVWSQED